MYAGKKVLIVGLGRFGGGIGVIRYLAQEKAKLRITDLKRKEELKLSLEKIKDIPAEYIFGQHRLEDLNWADVIVFNPAVPPSSTFFQAALKSGKKLETEINILFQISHSKIIGVSGTNGKATVSGLIASILKKEYGQDNVFLAGNMGISLLDKAEKLDSGKTIILELSSFQLNRLSWLRRSPQVSVLTNITQDHLEWHGSFVNYQQDKLNLFRYQKKEDTAIINLYDPVSKKLLQNWPFRSQVYYLNNSHNKLLSFNHFLVNNQRYFIPQKRLLGRHNQINILQAILTSQLLGAKKESIIKGVIEFQPPEHALEYVTTIKGIKFINDSEASNQDAAVKGLLTFPNQKIILIAGGYDKKTDLSRFVKTIKQRVRFVILIGQTASKLAKQLEKIDYFNYQKAKNLKTAVELSYQQAKKGDYVLLSPAASSYDMFKNLEERGELFKKYVHQLEKEA